MHEHAIALYANFQNTSKTEDVAELVECFPPMLKPLGFIHSTA